MYTLPINKQDKNYKVLLIRNYRRIVWSEMFKMLKLKTKQNTKHTNLKFYIKQNYPLNRKEPQRLSQQT